MEQFIKKLKACNFPITEEKLKDIIVDSVKHINYKNLVITTDNNNSYIRIKLLNNPFDVYLMV